MKQQGFPEGCFKGKGFSRGPLTSRWSSVSHCKAGLPLWGPASICGTDRPRPTGYQCPLPGTCTHLFVGLSLRSPLGQHLLHGGERGRAGADGHDGPDRPGHRGRVSGLRDGGEQQFWAPARYRQPERFVVEHRSCSCPQHLPSSSFFSPGRPALSVARPSAQRACVHAHPLYKDSPVVSGQPRGWPDFTLGWSLPLPTSTAQRYGARKCISLQKTRELRHFPESAGQILLS